jgi:hypothetical protein
MSAKYSLTSRIHEVQREIEMRERVYARQVYPNSVWRSKGEADLALDIMRDVGATLEWLKENEADIRAFIDARRKAA